MSKKITIGHLYPELLNLYGDAGNLACLVKRCQWRGIDAEVITFDIKEKIDFANLDIVLLGGGSDREEKLVCEALRFQRDALLQYVEDGGVLLAVCGGYQMLGNTYQTAKETVEGLAVLNIETTYDSERWMGNAVVKSALTNMPIVGFENHNGRMHIGDGEPLGQVIAGKGNDGNGAEGILYKNTIGTYLYGPLLPKNPELCDWLIASALERRYGESELEQLDDGIEQRANEYMVNRCTAKKDN